jgi:hypothetical protein
MAWLSPAGAFSAIPAAMGAGDLNQPPHSHRPNGLQLADPSSERPCALLSDEPPRSHRSLVGRPLHHETHGSFPRTVIAGFLDDLLVPARRLGRRDDLAHVEGQGDVRIALPEYLTLAC